MLHAFALFANPAAYSGNAAINPWTSYFIIMLAFGGAVLAARAKNDLLTVAFAAVALFFGALAASSLQKALNYEHARVETLQASLAGVHDQQSTQVALRENIQLERDSLHYTVQRLQARVEELESRPAPAQRATVARPVKKRAAVKPSTAVVDATPTRPQTYAATAETRLQPQTSTRYKYVGEFRYGIAPVKGMNNKWGYISDNGAVVVPPFLKASCTLHAGLGGVKNDANLWGYVNRFGQLVIPYRFNEALAFEEDTQQALVQQSGHWVWINTKGQVMRPAKGSELRARKRIPVIAAR
jgi:hypothetical protein